MKKINLLLLLVFALQTLSAQQLSILATTDLHSKLTGFGPEKAYTPLSLNDDPTSGGFARIATIIKNEKEKHPGSTVVLDAGDFLMGTIFHADEAASGFQLRLMHDMGYEALTIGNHEFDYGPRILADIISTAHKKGDIPQLLASQMQFHPESPETKGLEKLFRQGVIKPYTLLEKQGLRIGIFGLIGEGAISVAPDSKPVVFTDQYKTAEQMTALLKNNLGADIVICLSHSGLTLDEAGHFGGEDYSLAKKVPEIDIILSGHTHLLTREPVKVGNTLIIQSGSYGKHVARLNFEYRDSRIINPELKIISINDEIPADKEVHDKIETYKARVNRLFFKPFGLEYSEAVARTDFDLKRGTEKNKIHGNLGPFTADAIKYYTDKYARKTDVSIIANGTIREHILKGEITPADVFRVLPLGSGADKIPGNSLAMIYITPKELKKLTEVIIMSNTPGTDSYLYVSGIDVYYNPKKMMLRKVQKIERDGKPLDFSKSNKKLVSITADTYLLKFVGRIKQMSKGLVKIVPKDKNGRPIDDIYEQVLDFNKERRGLQEGKQWLAVIEYLKSFAQNGDIPKIPEKYQEELTQFHSIKK